MARAVAELPPGASREAQIAAMARHGLSESDAKTLLRLGINHETAAEIAGLARKHGQDLKGRRFTDYDDGEWNAYDGAIDIDINEWRNDNPAAFVRLSAAVNREIYNMIAEPSLGSRPLMNNRTTGALINQFQSFVYSWTNQTLQIAAQQPVGARMAYASLALALGGISAATHNALTGRRTLEDSVAHWINEPLTASYEALQRSPLLGWLNRVDSLANLQGVGLGSVLGRNYVAATQQAHVNSLIDAVGPTANYGRLLYEHAFKPMGTGRMPSARDREQLKKLTPYLGLWQISGAQRVGEYSPLFDHME